MVRISPPAALLGAVGLTLLVYWPGLNGPLILDDLPNLAALRRLDAQGALTLANLLAEKDALLAARPVAWLSFLLNWRVAGDDIWALKLTNLAIHVLNGVLVYLLAGTLLRFSPGPTRPSFEWWAVFAAALWLLTPAQVSSVLYVIQRMAELSGCFTLLGMLAWSRARLSQQQRPRRALFLMGASLLLCWPLATLSKQNGVLLVLLLLITEWLLIAPAGKRPAWPGRVLALIVASLLCLAVLRAWLDPGWILDGYVNRDFTVVERLLTQPRVLLHQLLNVFQLPGGTPLGLFHDDFTVSRALLDPPQTLAALTFWCAVPIAAWRLRATDAALPMFGLAFFLAAHSLEAGPFALEIYFEHRSYLPSFGPAVAAAALGALAVRHGRWSRLAAVLAVIVLAGYATLTGTRVLDWTSWNSIVAANASRHPGSVRAQTGMAVVALQAGKLEEGLAALDRVRHSGGTRVRSGLALHALSGYCLAGVAPPPEALSGVAQVAAIDDDPYTVGALRWYREVVPAANCPGQRRHEVALLISRRVLRLSGAGPRRGNWILHDEAARILAAVGEPSIARLHLSRARRFAPPSARPDIAARQAALRDR